MTDNKIKIQIKSVFGKVLFEYEKEGNTVKDTVEEAVKQKADLSEANLSWADLSGADLSGADLSEADLSWAHLSGANLSWADLSWADLSGADLSEADLSEAHLSGADLSEAKNIPFVPFSCPSDGAFVGWKKIEDKLIKLLIPEDAKRQSSTGWKCRCDKAKVLEITDLDGSNPISEITSTQYAECTYKVGEIVYPDSFDDNRWKECSHGIHFFINKQQAIDY